MKVEDSPRLRAQLAPLREAVVRLVSASPWPKVRFDSEADLERLAYLAGVAPDVLREAKTRFHEAHPANAEKPEPDAIVTMRLPVALWPKLQGYANERGWPAHALLRTMLHEYLSGSREPLVLSRYQHERVFGAEGMRLRPKKLRLPRALARALSVRADARAVKQAAIVRALCVELFAGKVAPPKRIILAGECCREASNYVASSPSSVID